VTRPQPSIPPVPKPSRRPSRTPLASRSSASSRRPPALAPLRSATRSGPPHDALSNHVRARSREACLNLLPCRVGVVFSGRQSPGGHNVVWGLHDALKAYNPQSLLYGFVGNQNLANYLFGHIFGYLYKVPFHPVYFLRFVCFVL
jgi:hypothetical protein